MFHYNRAWNKLNKQARALNFCRLMSSVYDMLMNQTKSVVLTVKKVPRNIANIARPSNKYHNQ